MVIEMTMNMLKRIMFTWCICVVLSCCVCLAWAKSDNAKSFTVVGKVTYSNPPGMEGTNVSEITLYNDRGQWKMLEMPVVVFPGAVIPPQPTEYGMIDGTNTYKLYHFQPSKKDPPPINEHALYLSAGPVPLGGNIFWAAFCGGEYLGGKDGKGKVEPLLSPSEEFQRRRMKLDAEWKVHVFESPIPILESYVSYSGAERFVYQNGKYIKRDVSKSNKGLTNVTYNVSEWTNVSDQIFPVKAFATTDFFSISKKDIKTENIVHHWMRIEIEKIIPGVPDDVFQLNVPAKTQVYDKRILADGELPMSYDYFSKTGSVKMLDDVLADPVLSDLKADVVMEANTPERNLLWVYGLVAFLFLLPPVFYLVKSKQKKNILHE